MCSADPQLLSRAAAGDSEALGTLYDRYSPTLFPVALRIVAERPEAEDVVHDAFVSAVENAAKYSPQRGSVVAWLITITRNLAIDRARRRSRRDHLGRTRVASEPGEPERAPESIADARARAGRVRRALDELSPAQRATIESAFFEGLSYAELAGREGVPLGTVKSRAARALSALRDALARNEHRSCDTRMCR